MTADDPFARAAARYAAGELTEALAIYDGLAESSATLKNRGVILRQLGRFDDAEAAFRRALVLTPNDADAAYYHGMMRLWRGDFVAGWREYERRPAVEELRATQPAVFERAWTGDDLAGRRLLLISEQGFGDAMQFVRYLPQLAARAAHVVLDCHPELARLFRMSLPDVEVVGRGGEVPPVDATAMLLSVPHLTGMTSLREIPAAVPYLRAPPDLSASWAGRAAVWSSPRVGIAWSGRPTHPDERLRSLALAALAPLITLPAGFVSLQVDDPSRRKIAALGWQDRIVDPAEEIADFADTAALLNELDLVITVDTAVAHLAAALGRPVWLLLPYVCDWRWLDRRRTSPWYPTIRLFRQPASGDWGAVIAAAARALSGLINSRSRSDAGH